MEFGKHIGKGLWAFADKSLPAIYGVGFIFLVVRTLSETDFGALSLVQAVFLISTALGYSLALQPLTKFAAEHEDHGSYIVASLLMSAAFFGLVSVLLFFSKALLPLWKPSARDSLGPLLNYVPLLFLASLYRNFAVSLLQATYRIQRIFWIDATYYLGVLAMMYVAKQAGRLTTPEDVLNLNVAAYGCSTVLAFLLTRRYAAGGRLALRRLAFVQIWDFGKYTFGATISYTIFAQADVFFIGAFGGLAATGMYSAAKIFTRIYDMIVQVIQMFVIPASSRLFASGKTDQLRALVEKSVMFSILLMIPVFLAFSVFPGIILRIFYHGRYTDAAGVLQIFALLAFAMPWNAVCGSLIQGIGHVKFGFKLSGVLLLLTGVTFGLLTPRLGIYGAAAAYVLTLSLITIGVVAYTRKIVGFRFRDVFKRIADIQNFVVRRASGEKPTVF